ncbi:cytochrome b [Pedomonas mirosovicensis]|uniref:cytochrome b n=1 Tax=Pedomonas mirosovicensis TaxID=2908641 RepID=UPI00216A1B9A|nr:cytochrome b [Pedomonas mirosovicensis]MCH8684793.1 cytochrome b [Pedomonas mirosovicensis]
MSRYSTVAVILHWLIALSVIALLIAGFWMGGAIRKPETQAVAFEVFQLHKSLGLTVLALTLARLAWRLGHRPPALPDTMPRWQKTAAHATAWAFYAILLVMPLSGWAIVSTSPFGLPTMWFGLFEWPHIAPLAEAANAQQLNATFEEVHELLAWGTLGLLFLHVAGALKHHFIDRDNVLVRMAPWLSPRSNA